MSALAALQLLGGLGGLGSGGWMVAPALLLAQAIADADWAWTTAATAFYFMLLRGAVLSILPPSAQFVWLSATGWVWPIMLASARLHMPTTLLQLFKLATLALDPVLTAAEAVGLAIMIAYFGRRLPEWVDEHATKAKAAAVGAAAVAVVLTTFMVSDIVATLSSHWWLDKAVTWGFIAAMVVVAAAVLLVIERGTILDATLMPLAASFQLYCAAQMASVHIGVVETASGLLTMSLSRLVVGVREVVRAGAWMLGHQQMTSSMALELSATGVFAAVVRAMAVYICMATLLGEDDVEDSDEHGRDGTAARSTVSRIAHHFYPCALLLVVVTTCLRSGALHPVSLLSIPPLWRVSAAAALIVLAPFGVRARQD